MYKVDIYINTTKWYNLQEDMKICENCEKKEQKKKFIIFSCNKYDNIQRKVINDINEMDNVKLQIGNKIGKLKIFLAEGSLKALNIFGQFLVKAFESRQQTGKQEEIRHTKNGFLDTLSFILVFFIRLWICRFRSFY